MSAGTERDFPSPGTETVRPEPRFGQSRETFRAFARAFSKDTAGAAAAASAWMSASAREWRRRAADRRIRQAEERENARSKAAEDEPAEAASAETAAAATRRSWRPSLIGGLAAGAALGLAMLGVVLVWALHDVPWAKIAAGTLEPVLVLEAADGQPLVTQGPYREGYVPFDEFPDHLIDAVTTVEDRRFFEHNGLDFWGIGRALVRNVWAGEVVEGGSTITQQLVKISFLEHERTFKRKIQEAVIALWLEWRLGKEEILTRYLNSIYLGAGATGVPAAARIYFDKEVGELSITEAAMLAAIIRAPSALNPIEAPQVAQERAERVLDAMVANGKLEAGQVAAARADVASLNPTKPAVRSGSWFADWASEDGREIAGSFGGTIKVRTTLMPRLQALAEQVITDTLDEVGAEYGVSQAALVAMTPDGAVVAMVGGRDYEESAFNRAVQAFRQPGSTFKLFVYHAALKAGIPMRARIDDEPVDIDGWTPENVGGRYHGRVTLAEAFARSLNVSAVKLAMEVGIENVVASARELGIDAELTETPSLALGTSEVSLLDLTGAYASVRAGVAPVEPFGVVGFSVEGEGQSFAVVPAERPRVELGQDQRDLVGLLRLAVERGTGREADFGAFAAGKTGTSQDHRDAWFIGFTETLVAGVWVGNDDNSAMEGVTGGKLPALIWRRFMEGAVEEVQPAQEEGTVTASTEAPLTCNVRACSRAYRSFRPSDCTFQPYQGPRKLCEK